MLVYHCTTAPDAEAIRVHGFHDAPAFGGVAFFDRPPVEPSQCPGDVLLTVELVGQDADSLRRFEWVDPDHRALLREWLIPAAFVNPRAVIVSVDTHLTTASNTA